MRLWAGVCVAAACVLPPQHLSAAHGWAAATLVGWAAVCGVQAARPAAAPAGVAAALGAALALWAPQAAEAGLAGRLGWIGLHTLMAMAAALVTARAVGAAEAAEALRAAPLPALARHILLSMLHQAPALRREAHALRRAAAVRAPSPRARRMLLRGLPAVWLPRLLQRADAVGRAMEIRGYLAPGYQPPRRPWTPADALAALAAAAAPLGVLALRAGARL